MVSMIGDATGLTIPTVFASQGEPGPTSQALPGATVRVVVDYTSGREDGLQRSRRDQEAATTNNVVMAGAHLDSVQDGAGNQRQRVRQRGAAGDRDPI